MTPTTPRPDSASQSSRSGRDLSTSPASWNEAARNAAVEIASLSSSGDPHDWMKADIRTLRNVFEFPSNHAYRVWARCLASHALVLLIERKAPQDATKLGSALRIADLAARKHHDYGTGNILTFGIRGLIVRTSDKYERLKNLLARGSDGVTEPLEDALVDIVGYAIVGMMLVDGWFELPLVGDVFTSPDSHVADVASMIQEVARRNVESTPVWPIDFQRNRNSPQFRVDL